jgi:hypothetical protein
MWFQQSSIHQKKADQWLMYSKISNEYSLSSYYIQFQFSITCSWKLNNCCDLTGHGFIRFNQFFPTQGTKQTPNICQDRMHGSKFFWLHSQASCIAAIKDTN